MVVSRGKYLSVPLQEEYDRYMRLLPAYDLDGPRAEFYFFELAMG